MVKYGVGAISQSCVVSFHFFGMLRDFFSRSICLDLEAGSNPCVLWSSKSLLLVTPRGIRILVSSGDLHCSQANISTGRDDTNLLRGKLSLARRQITIVAFLPLLLPSCHPM